MEIDLNPLARLFWDVEFTSLNWDRHRDFIIQRVLSHGDLNALHWLRALVDDAELKSG